MDARNRLWELGGWALIAPARGSGRGRGRGRGHEGTPSIQKSARSSRVGNPEFPRIAIWNEGSGSCWNLLRTRQQSNERRAKNSVNTIHRYFKNLFFLYLSIVFLFSKTFAYFSMLTLNRVAPQKQREEGAACLPLWKLSGPNDRFARGWHINAHAKTGPRDGFRGQHPVSRQVNAPRDSSLAWKSRCVRR